MPSQEPYPRTHLFTLRLWVEPVGCGQGEVRVRVTHLLSGETRYFRTWSDVAAFMLSIAGATGTDGGEEGGVSG